jgi:alkylation response protein AidB-like acyl-CoA dehydrogenase
MRFDLSAEQHAIKDTARALLTTFATRESRRAAVEAGCIDETLWRKLSELGWSGMAVAEHHGGQGMGLVELAVLAEELGYACASTPMLGTVTAALALEHAGSSAQQERWLPALASGNASGAFGVSGTRLPEAIADAGRADVLVTVDDVWQNARVAERDNVDVIAVDVVDLTRGYAYVDAALGEPLSGDVQAAIDRALVVISAELVGICQASLDLTVDYAKTRKQFGSPIGSFQAVSHTAAEMLRHTECARSATYYAAWAADHAQIELPLAASIAKATASDAGRAVTAAAVQMHGAFGFSWESELHWYYSRAIMDARLFGDARFHHARIAKLIADARRSKCRRIE